MTSDINDEGCDRRIVGAVARRTRERLHRNDLFPNIQIVWVVLSD